MYAPRSDARLDASEDVEPVRIGNLQYAAWAFNHGLHVQRNPDRRRVGVDPIAEEARRSDANDRNRLALDEESRANHVGIGSVRGLPCRVAEDRNRSGAGEIVGGLEHASGVSAEAKGREIIAGDIFGALGFCSCVSDPDIHHVASGLECR